MKIGSTDPTAAASGLWGRAVGGGGRAPDGLSFVVHQPLSDQISAGETGKFLKKKSLLTQFPLVKPTDLFDVCKVEIFSLPCSICLLIKTPLSYITVVNTMELSAPDSGADERSSSVG